MAPINDLFINAIALTGKSFHVEGSNVGATGEPGEPNHADSALNNGELGSVWWKWKAPISGSISINTHGSGYWDPILAAYKGSSVNQLTPVASGVCWNGVGSISFPVKSGVMYRIAVDGWMGDASDIVLNMNYNGTAGDDHFEGSEYVDIYYGGWGDDVINGNGGFEWVFYYGDELYGEGGDDVINGSPEGLEELDGGPGNDIIRSNGGWDIDWLTGGTGNDLIVGSPQHEAIDAGPGNDTIRGKGNDFINSGSGYDMVYLGESGDDIQLNLGLGSDRIFNFQAGQAQFRLADNISFEDLTFRGSGSDTKIFVGDDLLAVVVKTSVDVINNPDNFYT